MDPASIGGVIVAIVAAFGAWAAQRSAAKASKINTTVSGRLEAERGAYERARTFDLGTISRQDDELAALREELRVQKEKRYKLQDELTVVKQRLARLEALYPEWERYENGPND